MLVILSLATEQLVRWPFSQLQKVALFFPGFRYACQVALGPIHGFKEMHPTATREPTGLGVISKATKDVPAQCFLAVTGFLGKNCTPYTQDQSARELLDHFQCSRIARTQRDLRKKSKDKGKGPIQRRIVKGTSPGP